MNPLLFTDPAFLFCFAPVVLTTYYLLPASWRNAFLLTSSLVLYAWGEGRNVAALLASIAFNYACGAWIARGGESSRRVLAFGVTANLLLLALFKYAGFIVANFDVFIRLFGLPSITVPKVRLPVGLSFFTFMAISYLVDVYRRQTDAEKNPATFALYISLFPHLIAGPIVRFKDIAEQLHGRIVT
ncbi:MAG: MBOAT family protein, partial [Acidobacteriota bacterium]|nr:MBOAT family protein [Acidobacteriota bacterium]